MPSWLLSFGSWLDADNVLTYTVIMAPILLVQKKELISYFKTVSGKCLIQEMITDHGIQWHFIPSAASHFGELWEAAVKSAKTYLIKMSGSALLNFEEMTTLLSKIEDVFNNRPLTPTSNYPSDYTALTPTHYYTCPSELGSHSSAN